MHVVGPVLVVGVAVVVVGPSAVVVAGGGPGLRPGGSAAVVDGTKARRAQSVNVEKIFIYQDNSGQDNSVVKRGGGKGKGEKWETWEKREKWEKWEKWVVHVRRRPNRWCVSAWEV